MNNSARTIPLVLVACFLAGPSVAAEKPLPIALAPGISLENVEEPFEYFANSWTVIGLPDHPSGTRISPRGELVLAGGVKCRPLVGIGEGLFPLSGKVKKTLLDGWIPVVRLDFVLNQAVRNSLEAFASPMGLGGAEEFLHSRDGNYLNLLRVRLTNQGAAPAEAHFGLQWEPEKKLEIREDAPRKETLVLAGGSLLCAVRAGAGTILGAEGSRIQLKASLASGASREILFSIPFEPVAGSGPPPAGLDDFDSRSKRIATLWRDLLARGARLQVPEEKPLKTYLASLAYQLIGRDRGEIHAGEGFYDEIYLRDGAYQAISLAHAGFLDLAREGLEHFLRYQKDSGQFVSQEGQLDANGYAIWALVEYSILSGDEAWLRRVYPAIRKSVEWIRKTRRTEKDPASPFSGVLPAAPADGEFLWDGKHHILGYDWQNLRGIQSAAVAARRLGEAGEAAQLENDFEEYRLDILKAVERTGLPYYPPSYEKVGTHWGNLEAVFPTLLIDPRDERLKATLDFVREEFGSAGGAKGGFMEGTIQWNPGSGAIHPYMSQFVTNSLILRGDQDEAVDGFYSFLLHTTSTHGFPEGVYFRRREAWGDTVPHLWAAALYVTTLRNMLVREEGETLHLLSAVPAHWLDEGKEIRLEGAPTRFGRVRLLVTGKKDSIDVSGGCERPSQIVLHVPPSISIERPGSEARKLVLPPGEHRSFQVEVPIRRAAAAGAKTFASTAAEYEAEAASLLKPIPGLAQAPAGGFDEGSCRKLDLSRVATTDPLKAPFEVPGAPTFADLPLGDQRIAGVPFRIIDPAKNGGKGLVVLNGAHSCTGLPREAEVLVGDQGKFLCILGNVTGWGPDDPGVGDMGAVAEYEVLYKDGSRQKVPLISGRTADDWLQEPRAAEAALALKRGNWHLHLLVLLLEPKPVDRVVFRDLGTPSSPVVAAMTLVR